MRRLVDMLLSLVSLTSEIRGVAALAGVPVVDAEVETTARTAWISILTEAQKHDRVERIVDVVAGRYPKQEASLREALQAYQTEQASAVRRVSARVPRPVLRVLRCCAIAGGLYIALALSYYVYNPLAPLHGDSAQGAALASMVFALLTEAVVATVQKIRSIRARRSPQR